MTQAEAVAFLGACASAFDTFDAESIAEFFALPCMILAPGASVAFSSRADLVANFHAANDRHRALGYHRAVLLECSVNDVGTTLSVVDGRWEFLRQDGSSIDRFSMRYILRSAESKWKILVAMSEG